MAENQEVVTMGDGRKVTFAGKRRAIKSSTFEDGIVKVRIDFRNGVSKVYTVPQAQTERAACHGGEQKFGDSYAGLEDIDDMIEACDSVQENLNKGDWNARVEGSGIAGSSVLARALVEATGKQMDEIRTWLKARTQAEKLQLRNSSKLKPIVERLEAEKSAKAQKVDVSGLMAEVGLA